MLQGPVELALSAGCRGRGVVTDLTSWRVIFWAYLRFAGVLAAVVAVSVPRDAGGGRATSLNLLGSAAFTGAVMAFVVGTSVITRPDDRTAGVTALAACAALAVAFGAIDRRAAAPLLPADLLGSWRLRQGALGGFLNTATTSSVVTLLTLYLQDTLHRSPLFGAAALLPFSLAVIGGSAGSASLLRRLQPQSVVAIGLGAIAAADLALIVSAGSIWPVPVCAAAAGAGIGVSSVAATGLGTDVPERRRGSASGIINTAAQLGTALGIAALLLIAAATTGVPGPGTPPPSPAWAVAAAVAAAGAVRFGAAARRRVPVPGRPVEDNRTDVADK